MGGLRGSHPDLFTRIAKATTKTQAVPVLIFILLLRLLISLRRHYPDQVIWV